MAEPVCYSCTIFEAFNEKTLKFCEAFYNAVTPDLRMLLSYLFMLWIVFRLCEILMGKNEDLNFLLKEFIDLSIAAVLLQTFAWWKGLFFWFYNFGMYLGTRVLSITSEGAMRPSSFGITMLLMSIEDSFTPILEKIGIMVSDVSWTNLKISLAMIPVAVIYFMLLLRIFSSLFNVFVQMFALSLLSPILCALYALPPIRGALFGALRIALVNATQIILACGSIGIVLMYLNSLSMFTQSDVSITVGTVGYMQMLFTGALLWGAYGIIIGTPYQIFNTGNISAPNAALSFALHLPSKLMHTAKKFIPK